LVDSGIKLNEKSIKSGIFSLEISDIDIYAQGIKVAHVDHMNLLITLLFNKLDIDNIVLDKSLNSLAHFDIQQITTAKLTHMIFSPMKATIFLDGEFGQAVGYINAQRILRLDFAEIQNSSSLKRILQKDDNGWYYETKF